MNKSKKATRFVEKLAEDLLRKGELSSYGKKELRQYFDRKLHKLEDDDLVLNEYIQENHRAYRKLFARFVKSQLKNNANLKTALTNQEENSDGLPYNLFASSKLKMRKLANRSSEDCLGICSAFLYERLDYMQNCDEVLKILQQFQSSDGISWVEEIRKLCTVANFQSLPKVLQLCMGIFTIKLSEQLQRNRKQEKSLIEMKCTIENFVTFCARMKEETKEFSAKPKYLDLLASIVSIYVDTVLLLFHDKSESEKRKEGRRLCGWVSYVFCDHPDFVLDVLIQISACKPMDEPVVLPLCKKALSKPTGEYDEAFYTKYVISVCQYARQYPDMMSDILVEARGFPAPGNYMKWLQERDASIAEMLTANNKVKKNKITKYFIKNAGEDLLSRLLNLLTDSNDESHVTKNLMHDRGDNEPDFAESAVRHEYKGAADEPIVAFFIDRQSTKDVVLGIDHEITGNDEIEPDSENLFFSDSKEEEKSDVREEARKSKSEDPISVEILEEEDDSDEETQKTGKKDGKIEEEKESEAMGDNFEKEIDEEETEISEEDEPMEIESLNDDEALLMENSKEKSFEKEKNDQSEVEELQEQRNEEVQEDGNNTPLVVDVDGKASETAGALEEAAEISEVSENQEDFNTKEEERTKEASEEIDPIKASDDLASEEGSWEIVDSGSNITDKDLNDGESSSESELSLNGDSTVDVKTGERNDSAEKQSQDSKKEEANVESPRTFWIKLKRLVTPAEAEKSPGDKEHEQLINNVLECINNSQNDSDKDMFEEFDGDLSKTSPHKKNFTNQTRKTSPEKKSFSPPKVDPTILKTPTRQSADSTDSKLSHYDLRKQSPDSSSTISNLPLTKSTPSKRQRPSSASKSSTKSRQRNLSAPEEVSKNLDELLVPDSSEPAKPSTSRRKLKSVRTGLVPDLSRFLKGPCSAKDVYDFESDASPFPDFTRILMRYEKLEDRNTGSSPKGKIGCESKNSVKHSATDGAKKVVDNDDGQKDDGQFVAGQRDELEDENGAPVRRSARIQQLQSTLPKDSPNTPLRPTSSSRKRKASSSAEKLKTKALKS